MERLLPRVVATFESFRANTYPDPVGLPTIGYGHLIQPGETFDEPLSRPHALLLLETDLAIARRAVDRLFRNAPSMADYQWDALTSWMFNVGEGNAADSTLLRKVLAGNLHGASHEFLKWVYATRQTPYGPAKIKLPGLVRRRDIESVWFLGAAAATVERLAGVVDDD